MDGEDLFWLRFWQSTFVFAAFVAVIVASCESYQTRLYLDKGYTRQSVTNQKSDSSTQWVKP